MGDLDEGRIGLRRNQSRLLVDIALDSGHLIERRGFRRVVLCIRWSLAERRLDWLLPLDNRGVRIIIQSSGTRLATTRSVLSCVLAFLCFLMAETEFVDLRFRFLEVSGVVAMVVDWRFGR